MKNENYEIVNILLLSLAAFLGAVQLVIIAALLFNRVPLDDSLKAQLLPEALALFKPEREILFYRLLIATAIGIQAISLGIFRQRLNEQAFYRAAKQYVFVEALLVFCLSFTLLRMISLGKSLQLTAFFYASLGFGVLFKIFWLQKTLFSQKLIEFFNKVLNSFWVSRILDCLLPVFIALVLFIPDLKGVVAKIFYDDLWFHIDNFIMSAGWAVSKGLVPFVDINGQYGVGMPIVISFLVKGLGGFNYQNVLSVMVCLAIFYFILCYCFLRVWLRNVFLAVFGVILAMKMQVFFLPAEFAFIWKYPSHTVVRLFFDIPFFFLLWLHISKRKEAFLILALICAGAGSFYVLDSGVYLLLSAYGYLILIYSIPAFRKEVLSRKQPGVRAGFHFALPLAIMLLLMAGAVKEHVWTRLFWQNMVSFNSLSLGGVGAISLKTPLAEGAYGLFFEGCALIGLYIFTILFNLSLIVVGRKDQKHLLPVIMSVYGLALLHYWIFASVALKVPPVCIPGVLVFCYWVREILEQKGGESLRLVPPLLVGLVLLAFLTTPGVLCYPNVFNARRISYALEEENLAKEFNNKEDVELITRLTTPQEQVALISVFESYLFITADRKPFFYEGPMLNPRRFEEREFGGSRLLAKRQVQDMVNQLEEHSPSIIFVEKRLVSGQMLKIYYQHYLFLNVMTAYLQGHYVPYEEGKYLIALKRVGKKQK